MTAPTDEFDQLCLTEYITAERLVEGLPPHPKDGEGIEAD